MTTSKCLGEKTFFQGVISLFDLEDQHRKQFFLLPRVGVIPWTKGGVFCACLTCQRLLTLFLTLLVLKSLERIGVCGDLYKWFVDYHSDRKQCVVFAGLTSSSRGSNLGPLLILLFFNLLQSSQSPILYP